MPEKMTDSEMVKYVEREMGEYRVCPLCGQYGGLENHQSGCPYLSMRSSNPTTEEAPDGGVNSNPGADVVSVDETPLPVTTDTSSSRFGNFKQDK